MYASLLREMKVYGHKRCSNAMCLPIQRYQEIGPNAAELRIRFSVKRPRRAADRRADACRLQRTSQRWGNARWWPGLTSFEPALPLAQVEASGAAWTDVTLNEYWDIVVGIWGGVRLTQQQLSP